MLCLTLTAEAQHRYPDLIRMPDFVSQGAVYAWPSNASDYFSATFAETRSAHFHAAADIGTWGQEGFDVYATRDGVLFRIGISPHGYGNVIYLKHDDDSFSVYAHLQDFHPEIRTIADSVRIARGYINSLDIRAEDYNIQFRKGDFIGRTGSTGIGPPHLHFELRSPHNDAINPKLAGIHVADRVSPVFSGLAVIPVDAESYVRGRKDILRLNPVRRGGDFHFGTIETQGSFGLAVNASDRADNGRNVYAVYELKAKINGKAFFHSRVDSFPMADGRKMLIDRVYPILLNRNGGYQRLHIMDGNNLPFYDRTLGNGILSLPPGNHQIEIIAADYYGNESRAFATISVTEPTSAPPDSERFFAGGSPIVSLPVGRLNRHPEDVFRWSKGWISPRHNIPVEELTIRSSGVFNQPSRKYKNISPHTGLRLSGSHIEINSEQTGPFVLHRIVPGQYTEIRNQTSRTVLRFEPDSVFDTTYVHVSAWNENGNTYFRISPEDIPLRRPFELTLNLADSSLSEPGWGVYFVNERRNRLDFISSVSEKQQIKTRLNGFGTFTIARDTTAPQLSRPRLWRRAIDGQWFVSVRAVDLMSGINFDQVEFYVNGVRGIPEYDPFGHFIRYHKPDFQPVRGRNKVSIRVPDRSGNVTVETYELNH